MRKGKHNKKTMFRAGAFVSPVLVGLLCFCVALCGGCRTSSGTNRARSSSDGSFGESEVLSNQVAQILGGQDILPDPDESGASADDSRAIRPGDKLNIEVWMRDKISQLKGFPFDVEVGETGSVFVPHLGLVEVAGSPADDVQAGLQGRFAQILKDSTVILRREPRVSRTVAGKVVVDEGEVPAHVIVMGQISKPGIYPLTPDLRLRDAIAVAGGLEDQRAHKNIYLVRGTKEKPEVFRVNMDDIFLGRDLSKNYPLQHNDAIYVATKQLWKMADFIRTLLSPVMAVRDSLWVYDRFMER